jgi:replicative DNA helicase
VLVFPPIATACQGLIEVEPRPGWREPVNVFVSAVLPPATRKGPVFSDTSAPVVHFEAAEVERLRDRVAEQNALLAAGKARVEHLTQAVAKARTPEDAADARNQLAKAARELAQMKPAALPRYLVDDVTPEKLASILVEQDGRLAVFAPEGGELFELMNGRYGNGPNFGVFLKTHAGDALRVDRLGRVAESVERPALTIAMAVQPDVIAGLHAKAGFRGRGLLGRFLYAVPVPTLGKRRTDAPPVPAEVRRRYRENVAGLLKVFAPSIPGGGRHVLRFEPDGYDVFHAFEDELEPRLGAFGDLGHVADWAGKLAGAVARIAGLLHVAGNAEAAEPWIDGITADEARSAVEIGRYFLGHALVAFGMMGADPALEAARHLLRWVEQKGLDRFTKRDLFEGVKGRFPKADDLDAPLRLLARHGYVREKATEARTYLDGANVRGRKPSTLFEVNPAVLNCANTANCASHPVREDAATWTL